MNTYDTPFKLDTALNFAIKYLIQEKNFIRIAVAPFWPLILQIAQVMLVTGPKMVQVTTPK